MLDLVAETTGVDFLSLTSSDEARAAASRIGVDVGAFEPWGKVVQEVFDTHVAERLQGPMHVLHPPRDVSPLARAWSGDPRLAERFETFCNGFVIANGCSELTDPDEQREQFDRRMSTHLAGGYESQLLDEEYLGALAYGMAPTAGVGIAVDRLVMVMTGASSIREVITFPTLRSRTGANRAP
jgi:lysyl-tRNA synthetase class 2